MNQQKRSRAKRYATAQRKLLEANARLLVPLTRLEYYHEVKRYRRAWKRFNALLGFSWLRMNPPARVVTTCHQFRLVRGA